MDGGVEISGAPPLPIFFMLFGMAPLSTSEQYLRTLVNVSADLRAFSTPRHHLPLLNI